MKNATIPEVGQVWRSTQFSTQFVHITSVSVQNDFVKYTIHGDEYKSYIDYFQTQYLYSHTKKGLRKCHFSSL
jgi:hypothetical protein